ncbi:hypothetical protein [Undibacterium sp. TJN19]|uniref:hypothetical protein n=1 Tax=Undibacterium sp. TJN19 TaxID=3413055 RepID=UPI003BEFF858
MAGCARTESVQTLERRDLMRLVFKGWDSSQQKSIVKAPQLKVEIPALAVQGMRMDALQVVRLNEDIAVLLVKGEALQPISLNNGPASSAVSAAAAAAAAAASLTSAPSTTSASMVQTLLAAYWFQRRGEAWSLVNRQDVVEWLTPVGPTGDSKIIELFPGNFALALEHAQLQKAGQKTEQNNWLSLYRITSDKVSLMLEKDKDLELAQHVESAPECTSMMRPTKGKHARLHVHDIEQSEHSPEHGADHELPHCYDYQAKWEIADGIDTPGDITLNFNSKNYRYREVGRSTDSNGERTLSYDLQISAQKGNNLYHFNADTQKYQLVVADKVRRSK